MTACCTCTAAQGRLPARIAQGTPTGWTVGRVPLAPRALAQGAEGLRLLGIVLVSARIYVDVES